MFSCRCSTGQSVVIFFSVARQGIRTLTDTLWVLAAQPAGSRHAVQFNLRDLVQLATYDVAQQVVCLLVTIGAQAGQERAGA